MTGKHARPAPARTGGRTAGRRLAAGAIILAAGAAPLVAAAGAQAAAGTDPAAQGVGALPALGSLPLGLDALASPTGQALPLTTLLPEYQDTAALNSALPLVESVPAIADTLPLSSLTGMPVDGIPARQLLPRAAPLPAMADPLTTLGTVNPLDGAFTQDSLASVAASTSNTLGTVSQAVPGGGVGALTAGFTPQADALTGTVLQQTAPVVGQLQQNGVPTVGDLTDKISQTSLPMVGPVGHLTQTLPLSTVLGTANPLADTLSTATQL